MPVNKSKSFRHRMAKFKLVCNKKAITIIDIAYKGKKLSPAQKCCKFRGIFQTELLT